MQVQGARGVGAKHIAVLVCESLQSELCVDRVHGPRGRVNASAIPALRFVRGPSEPLAFLALFISAGAGGKSTERGEGEASMKTYTVHIALAPRAPEQLHIWTALIALSTDKVCLLAHVATDLLGQRHAERALAHCLQLSRRRYFVVFDSEVF